MNIVWSEVEVGMVAMEGWRVMRGWQGRGRGKGRLCEGMNLQRKLHAVFDNS